MPTIGETPYLSTLALTHPLRAGGGLHACQLVPGRLTELSSQLVEGSLDAGPITVQQYLLHADRLERIPNLSVSSWGRAGNGLLFSVGPIGSPQGIEIAVPSRAAGIVAVLRSLMIEMYGLEPSFTERTGPLDQLLREHGAALLYEDEALIASQEMSPEIEVWDLGDAWWELTHTPLIYMLWVCQSSLSAEQKAEIALLMDRAKAQSQDGRAELVAAARERHALPESVLEGFLGRFNYDFTPAHQAGLNVLSQTLLKVDPLYS